MRLFERWHNHQSERRFERLPVSVGRSPMAALVVPSESVAELHASIDVREGRLLVEDLGSAGGTHHGGRRLDPHLPVDVTDAPIISIGTVGLELEIRPLPVASSPDDLAAVEALAVELAPLIEATGTSQKASYRVLYDRITALEAPRRAAFLEQVAARCPELLIDPSFHTLAAYHGASADRLWGTERGAATARALRTVSPRLAAWHTAQGTDGEAVAEGLADAVVAAMARRQAVLVRVLRSIQADLPEELRRELVRILGAEDEGSSRGGSV